MHDGFIPSVENDTDSGRRDDYSFQSQWTLVSRKSYKSRRKGCCNTAVLDVSGGTKNNKVSQFSSILGSARSRTKPHVTSFDFPKRVFCMAHIWGIVEHDDDSFDDSESTHLSSEVDHHPRHRVHMARQGKRIRVQKDNTQEVVGDSGIDATARSDHNEVSKPRRLRFHPKDEVIVYDGKRHVKELISRERIYQGIRKAYKSNHGVVPALSSSGKNDGAGVEAPSLNPASDASVPDCSRGCPALLPEGSK